jgi:hypothetical protein
MFDLQSKYENKVILGGPEEVRKDGFGAIVAVEKQPRIINMVFDWGRFICHFGNPYAIWPDRSR